MKVKQILFFLLVSSWLCSSCGEHDCCAPPDITDYSHGIFVVNEGPWGGTGTISWHNPETGETRDSIFEKANNGAALGQFVQSMAFYGDKAYISVSGANRIVVVDAKTFEYRDTIGGLEQPRYFLPVESGLAYVSQWGSDGLSGSLAKVNLITNEVIATVPVGHGPEKMLFANGVIYVANSGGFGTDSTVVAVNPYTAQVLTKYATGGLNPANLAFTGQHFYALCKGNYDPNNPAGMWFGDLNPNTFGVQVASGSDDLAVSSDGTTFYFIGGGSVWKFQNSTLQKLFDQPAYGFALDEENNLLYCADAKGFTGDGEVVVYKTDGTKTGSFRTGTGPGEILIVK